MHAALREAASAGGISLNDYCIQRLSAPGPDPAVAVFSPVVELALESVGPALVGVAVFGSWARGDAVTGSDIDLLVVVEPDFALTRGSYAPWDDRPFEIAGRPVEPHIVRLPRSRTPMSGVWAEVAIDGIVLVDTGLRLSSYLADVRRAIAAGRLTRRVVHGQPFWHEVA